MIEKLLALVVVLNVEFSSCLQVCILLFETCFVLVYYSRLAFIYV